MHTLATLAEAALVPGLIASGALLAHAAATRGIQPLTVDSVRMRFRLWLIMREFRTTKPDTCQLAARH